MSCYVKHLEPVMDSLGLPNTKENRKMLDGKIRIVLGMQDAHCPEIWAEVKEILADEQKTTDLTNKIKELL